MTTIRPAEAFPPGEFLREELEERGWSQADFAAITGKDTRTINEVINGKRTVTPETAIAFAKALETSAELWLNLESQYQLWRATAHANEDDAIARRARLFQYPIREMSRRGWVDDSASLPILEQQLMEFFYVVSLNEVPHLEHVAKRSGDAELTPVQLAWMFRARHLAQILKVEAFTPTKLKAAIASLSSLRQSPEEIRQVSRILAAAGVRYVIVEGLPGNKIDGVCFWLTNNEPVIAMSIRFDRVDNFWFVLRHEIEHVLRGDGKGRKLVDVYPDVDLEATSTGSLSATERAANEAAAEFCVSQERLEDFVHRVGPYYAAKKIEAFAHTIGVHPGLVVGQLHRRQEIPHKNLRKLLVSVRSFVTATTLTDGWGSVPQITFGR
jgi:HTH-type transcriptional regulator / antitoxin HigA